MMPTRRIAFLLPWVASLTLLASCVGYAHRPHRIRAPVDLPPAGDYALAYVEADELGWFWDPAQANTALELVRQRADRGSVVVVTYVHGWHHSAGCCDSDVECFRSSLQLLAELLNEQDYRLALDDGPSEEIAVVGIYVGWRGRSLPWLLDYTTFWGRKGAAERVGGGDLRNFLHQLGRMHDAHALREDRFFGLVTIGHSFGGQAVFRSVSQLLEHQLVEAGPTSLPRGRAAPDAGALSGRGVPASDAGGAFITGLGDLIVLVNPAVEAAAFEPMRRLAAAIDFDTTLQSPALVVFSAENDFPRNVLFPAGRAAGTLFASRRSGQRTLDRRALGSYSRQQTHVLGWNPPAALAPYEAPTARIEREGARDSTRACRVCRYRGDPLEIPAEELDRLPENGDFGAALHLAGSELRPLPGARPFSPLLVIRTSPEIIDGHNGFFSHRFTNFLIRYVAGIEARRAATRRGRIDRLADPG